MKELFKQTHMRPLEYEDLLMVLDWRNSDRIRMVMKNTALIQWTDHLEWFEKLKADSTREANIVELSNEPFGVVLFVNKDMHKKTCEWGFYVGMPKEKIPLGKFLAIQALEYIFNDYEVVYAEVLKNNHRSISFHKDLGFMPYKENNDIIFLKLNSSDWRSIASSILEVR